MSIEALPTAFQHLAEDSNPAVEAALVEATPHFTAPEAAAALDLLIDRDAVNALAELIGMQRSLNGDVQAAFVGRTPRMRKALARAINATLSTQRVGAIELIASAGAYEDAYLLADALRVNCPRTRSSGAEALRRMVFRHLQARGDAASDDQREVLHRNESFLREALQRALRTWAVHLQVVALRAALWMHDQIWADLCQALDDPRTHVAVAVNNILADNTDPLLAGAVVRALTVSRLARCAARAISETRSSHYLKAVFAQGEHFEDGEVIKGLRKVLLEQWQHECLEAFRGLNPSTAATAVRVINATGSPKGEKLALYRRLIEDGDATIRGQVVEFLVQDRSEETTALLSLMAHSCETELADKIVAHTRQQPVAGTRTATAAPPDTVDDKTRSLHAAFEACWNGFDAASDDERRILLGQLRRAGGDPGPLLRSALAAPLAADRARALRLIRAMQCAPPYQDQIFQRARDTDPLVRSLAVAVLPEIGGASATRILRSLLNDPDPRVQANAIESLGRMRDNHGLELAGDKLASRHARVRANAIKALLSMELASAGETLLDMLADDSSAHRLSALWVVERMDIRAVIDQVTKICLSDPDVRLRRRAARVLEALGASARSSSAITAEADWRDLANAEGAS